MLKSLHLITVIVVASYCCCLIQANSVALHQVHQKLVDYVTQSRPTSGLTMDELKMAYDQYTSWPQEVREKLRETPVIRLVLDFVILPFGSAEHQLISGVENYQKFIERSELAYKEFWPIYQGGSGDEFIQANHFHRLLKFVTGQLPAEQLKLSDFIHVDNELKTWRARLDEISMFEDIFNCKSELKRILTYLNSDHVKALRSGVFPFLNQNPNPRELLDRFVNELFTKHGLRYQDGAWTKFVFPPGFDPSTMMDNIHLQSQINNPQQSGLESPIVVVNGAASTIKSSPNGVPLASTLLGMANKQDQQDMNKQPDVSAKNTNNNNDNNNKKGPWRLSAPEEEAYL